MCKDILLLCFCSSSTYTSVVSRSFATFVCTLVRTHISSCLQEEGSLPCLYLNGIWQRAIWLFLQSPNTLTLNIQTTANTLDTHACMQMQKKKSLRPWVNAILKSWGEEGKSIPAFLNGMTNELQRLLIGPMWFYFSNLQHLLWANQTGEHSHSQHYVLAQGLSLNWHVLKLTYVHNDKHMLAPVQSFYLNTF